MASRVLLLPLRSPLGLGLSLTAAYAFGTPLLPRPSGAQLLLSCDAEPFGRTSSDEWSYRRSPGARSGGVASPRVYRQISGGSIAGLVAGLAVSVFSRTLALLLGIVVFGVQFAAARGINIIPYGRIQKYVRGVDLRSALQDNATFKLSFGATFALASFVQL